MRIEIKRKPGGGEGRLGAGMCCFVGSNATLEFLLPNVALKEISR